MFFFLRYTKWLILPGKFILNNNISSTYKVQTTPPPFLNTKILLFWEFQNFPFDHFHRMMILYIPVGDMCENIHQQWQWETVTWQGVSAPSILYIPVGDKKILIVWEYSVHEGMKQNHDNWFTHECNTIADCKIPPYRHKTHSRACGTCKQSALTKLQYDIPTIKYIALSGE